MEAILLVGHGSRDPEGNEELLRFAEMVRTKAPQFLIETCFLEFAKPAINQGIENCVSRGATRVVLVPIILFAAGHAKLHIPDAIDHAKRKYHDVQFVYGRPIGVHQKVVNILRSRLSEAGYIEGLESGARDQQTAVLLLGRGSSDSDANSDFYKMARLFWEQVPVKWTESSFIGVTEPSFEDGLERCLQLGAKTIYVLPYFLFTGVLIKRIEQMVAEFAAQHPDCKVVLADYFGFHPELAELLIERVAEASEGRAFMNCDMCKYRLQAAAEIDHHHHHDHDHHDHDHHDHDHHAHGHDHEHDHHHTDKTPAGA
ncbi:sirohydrochlorin chelatase [Paenibacillus beijingensis]|uniref:Sirohydrochlorin cobaltochelatase n=1 Tax=Paenibacillus beijingensis TaxID=1126833 RepID=A0A0D5NNT3_9BACL|nr:sirohydrochlorin chelatase [Paenibacillus beijingensis]AJY76931.1 sirohydrochlorin cobaltochelatase [Paenibacillus beijingensis]